MIDFGVPLAGIQKAEASLNRSAQRLAGPSAPEGDVADLSAEMLALIEARVAIQANTAALKTELEASQTLLDLWG